MWLSRQGLRKRLRFGRSEPNESPLADALGADPPGSEDSCLSLLDLQGQSSIHWCSWQIDNDIGSRVL